MKTKTIIGCSIVGLLLGYFGGISNKANATKNRDDAAGLQTVNRSGSSSPRSRQDSISTRRNRKERPKTELTLTSNQVDLLLEQPKRYELWSISSIGDPSRDGNFIPSYKITEIAKFFELDEFQSARIAQKALLFSLDVKEILRENAVVDISAPGTIHVDLSKVGAPFRQRFEGFDDEMKAIFGSADYARLQAVTDIGSLADVHSEQSFIDINLNALQGSSDTTLQIHLIKNTGVASTETMLTMSIPIHEITEHLNTCGRLDPFLPDIDWNQILEDQLQSP